jgi:hypothetical protein
MLDEEIAGEFQDRHRLIARHRRKVVEKPFQAVPGGEVVKEILHGHSSANEDRSAAHDVGVNPDDRFKGGHASLPAFRSMVTKSGRGV